MSFIKDGSRIETVFNGKVRTGTVLESRLYFDQLKYTVLLDEPIKYRWTAGLVERLIVSQYNIKELV